MHKIIKYTVTQFLAQVCGCFTHFRWRHLLQLSLLHWQV